MRLVKGITVQTRIVLSWMPLVYVFFILRFDWRRPIFLELFLWWKLNFRHTLQLILESLPHPLGSLFPSLPNYLASILGFSEVGARLLWKVVFVRRMHNFVRNKNMFVFVIFGRLIKNLVYFLLDLGLNLHFGCFNHFIVDLVVHTMSHTHFYHTLARRLHRFVHQSVQLVFYRREIVCHLDQFALFVLFFAH